MLLRPTCAYPNLSRWLTRDTAHYGTRALLFTNANLHPGH
jgi:hypothetical protein